MLSYTLDIRSWECMNVNSVHDHIAVCWMQAKRHHSHLFFFFFSSLSRFSPAASFSLSCSIFLSLHYTTLLHRERREAANLQLWQIMTEDIALRMKLAQSRHGGMCRKALLTVSFMRHLQTKLTFSLSCWSSPQEGSSAWMWWPCGACPHLIHCHKPCTWGIYFLSWF